MKKIFSIKFWVETNPNFAGAGHEVGLLVEEGMTIGELKNAVGSSCISQRIEPKYTAVETKIPPDTCVIIPGMILWAAYPSEQLYDSYMEIMRSRVQGFLHIGRTDYLVPKGKHDLYDKLMAEVVAKLYA